MDIATLELERLKVADLLSRARCYSHLPNAELIAVLEQHVELIERTKDLTKKFERVSTCR